MLVPSYSLCVSLCLSLTHRQICCVGPGGPEKPNDQAEKPQVSKKKSVITLPLAHFIFLCDECFLWLSPFHDARLPSDPFSSSLFSAAGRILVGQSYSKALAHTHTNRYVHSIKMSTGRDLAIPFPRQEQSLKPYLFTV